MNDFQYDLHTQKHGANVAIEKKDNLSTLKKLHYAHHTLSNGTVYKEETRMYTSR